MASCIGILRGRRPTFYDILILCSCRICMLIITWATETGTRDAHGAQRWVGAVPLFAPVCFADWSVFGLRVRRLWIDTPGLCNVWSKHRDVLWAVHGRNWGALRHGVEPDGSTVVFLLPLIHADSGTKQKSGVVLCGWCGCVCVSKSQVPFLW